MKPVTTNKDAQVAAHNREIDMSDPVIRRVRRLIDESRNCGGMRVGMPKVTIDAADAERLCILVASALSAPRVPEAITEYKGYVPPEDGAAGDYYIEGWNDCRDEMLAAAPPTPETDELDRLRERVAELESRSRNAQSSLLDALYGRKMDGKNRDEHGLNGYPCPEKIRQDAGRALYHIDAALKGVGMIDDAIDAARLSEGSD